MSIGNISSFVLYSRKFSGPINEAANIISDIQSAVAAAERVFRLLEEDEETKDRESSVEIASPAGKIEGSHIQFGYHEEKEIIHDLSFHVEPGWTIAIVGPTGAGKTTLINLLLRFYDVSGGNIYLDGIETRDLKRDSLRQGFAMVLQDTWLFSGTIYENLSYASLDGLTKEEATSNVDTRTEMKIQKAMKKLMQDKTCFVIAHRLSTIRNADWILVIKDGDVAEQGTHGELLKKNGLYTELWNAIDH